MSKKIEFFGKNNLIDLLGKLKSEFTKRDINYSVNDTSIRIKGGFASGGGSVGAQVDLLGTLQPGLNTPLSTISQYDIVIFIVQDISEPWKHRGSGIFTKDEININNEIHISVEETERFILVFNNWYVNSDYNCKVYGIKFAPIQSNLHEYSTEERVVGKWIDGKPIYECVKNTNKQIVSNGWTVFDEALTPNLETLISTRFFYGNMTEYVPNEIEGGSGHIEIFSNGNSRTINLVIVQYTKTTD